jgi:hypothetical protein
MKDIPLGLCQCGCGQKTWIASQSCTKYGWKKGQPTRFIAGHNAKAEHPKSWKGGKTASNGYVQIWKPDHPRANKGYIGEHILVAEKALGRYLPEGAHVHHANEVRDENRNSNLVICQDSGYHMTLHRRMHALKACGNPNWRKCQFCKQYDDPANMWTHPDGIVANHRHCVAAYQRERMARRAA